jgi:hypothetical protein
VRCPLPIPPNMRRPLIPLIVGCLLLGAAPAHARYGEGTIRPDGVIDTWLVSGDRVVGRSQIQVSPAPTLTLSMVSGGNRVIAWRVMNVRIAPTIVMDAVCEGGGIGLRYLTPRGDDVTGDLVHGGFTQAKVDAGTFRTIYVHVHANRAGASLSCVLRGFGDGGFDKVLLDVHS